MNNIKSDIDIYKFLHYFKNSDFIITDSFHGTCLAIIFNKQFITIANKKRGLTRFLSLLEKLRLQNRLVLNTDSINYSQYLRNINYEKVNSILNKEINRSKEWLQTALSLRHTQHKVKNEIDFTFDKICLYSKYYRYKLLSTILLGSKRKHYQEKRKIYHEKVRKIRSLEKSI